MRDKARAGAFTRFLGKRVLEDDLFQAAGALSFTTVFALVPLSMVVFGVLSGFPLFAEWSEKLSDYIFSNFVPTAAISPNARACCSAAPPASATWPRR